MQRAIELATASQVKIAKLFEVYNDPIFDGIAAPPKVFDRDILAIIKTRADELNAASPSLLAEIDTILDAERQSAAVVVKEVMPLNPELHKDFTGGIDDRLVKERTFYSRQLAINDMTMKIASELADFLVTDAGEYELSDKGIIMFSTNALAEQYNGYLADLSQAIQQQEKLEADYAAYQKQPRRNRGPFLVGRVTSALEVQR